MRACFGLFGLKAPLSFGRSPTKRCCSAWGLVLAGPRPQQHYGTQPPATLLSLLSLCSLASDGMITETEPLQNFLRYILARLICFCAGRALELARRRGDDTIGDDEQRLEWLETRKFLAGYKAAKHRPVFCR